MAKQVSSENKMAMIWTAGLLAIAIAAGMVVMMFAS